MDTPDAPTPEFSTLVDYAMGRLSTKDSSKITQELERNPQASKNLEFVLKLIDLIDELHKHDLES